MTATRRQFLAAATAATAARSASRVIGANDRINVGMIGVGGMGTDHLRNFVQQSEELKDIQVTAVCDVYTRRQERARQMAKLEAKDVYKDHRELLARSDVDAVLIATPDHWHARHALDAMAAGKDVYLQKPMTYTIEEARQIAAAVATNGRVLQVGAQGLSAPGSQKARELVESGEIGTLLWAQAAQARNSQEGEWNWRIEPEGTEQTIDWKRWLGPAPSRPFSAERYFRWRKYWDYSGGVATDLFYHSLAPLLYAMGSQFPACVTAAGGVYAQKDREVPDSYATLVEYPNFYINLASSMANASAREHFPTVIYGTKGSILFQRSKLMVVYENPGVGAFDKPTTPGREPKVFEFPAGGDSHRLHTDNFFACMRSRKQPNLPASLGYRVMVAIRLGVDAYRQAKAMRFDAATEKVTDKPLVRHPPMG